MLKGKAPGFSGKALLVLALCLSLAASHTQSAYAADGHRRRAAIILGAGILGGVIAGKLAQRRYERDRSTEYAPSPRYRRGRDKSTRSRPARGKSDRNRSAGSKSVRVKPAGNRKTKVTGRAKPASPEAAAPQTAPAVSADATPQTATAAAAEVGPSAAVPASGVALISMPPEIASAQKRLRSMGYDVPQATGALDLKTKFAIMQFQESIGAETTGALTTDQLRLLLSMPAAR